MTIKSIQKPFETGLRYILITLVGALLSVMTVQILLRYGFNSSLLWAEEMCRYMLIWLSFLAVVMAFDRGEVVALTFLGNALPRVPALLLAIFCTILSIVFCVILFYFGIVFADRAGGSTIPAARFILEDIFGPDQVTAPTIFWVYIALPVGVALLTLRMIVDLVLCLRALSSGATLHDTIERFQYGAVE